ncbi:MAG TPA: toll/interleukin-1 receptor domain-containing protein [Thermoleophilaceae bacterium]
MRAAGFWSYTREDDVGDNGRVARLADQLKAEYGLITGDELELFVDRTSLDWGDQWRTRIDEALATTTFFIPVITPRYFRRPECRKELLTFAGHAQSLGVEELLLPLLYVEVPDLDEDSEDEAIALVAGTQYEDWRNLRLVDENSADYRQGVNRLATRLANISEEVADRPDPLPPQGRSTADGDADEGPGFLELLAEGEKALPRWERTITAFPDVLEEVATVTEGATDQMSESDARGGGFAARIAITRRLARELDAPAKRIAELGRSYASDLVAIDPAILTLLRWAEEDPDEAATPEAQEFFTSIQALAQASKEATKELKAFVTALDDASQMTREIRPQARTMREGLRDILDGQAVIDEWERRVSRVTAAVEQQHTAHE